MGGIIVLFSTVCLCSCFYNYKIVRSNKPPFKVPFFCPDCLFPKSAYKVPIDERMRSSMNESNQNEDPKIFNRLSDAPVG